MPRLGKPVARNRQTRVRRRHRSVEGTAQEAFLPLSISGLTVWHDFGDPNYIFTDAGVTRVTTSGDIVRQVNDKSGNGYHAVQATLGKRPLYTTQVVNGRAVARFDGTNDSLACTPPADTSFTIMVAAIKRGAVGAPQQCLIGMDNATGAADVETSTVHFATSNYVYWSAATQKASTPTNWNIIVLRCNSAASLDFYINGGTPTNLNPADAVTTSTYLGYAQNSGEALFGDYDVAELVKYDSAFTTTQLDSVGNYLAFKYALTWTAAAS